MTTASNNNCATNNDPLNFSDLAEKRFVALKSDIPRDREADISSATFILWAYHVRPKIRILTASIISST